MGLSLPSTSFFGIRFARIFARFVRVCPLTPGGQARVRPRAIFILPTGAGVVFAGILLLMLLGSLNYQNNLGLLFTFLTVAVVVVSMHHAWFNLLGLALSARAGRPVFAGDRALFDLQVVVETRKRRPDLRLVVGDQVALLDLVPGQDARTTLGVPTRRRGLQALGQVTLETRYPLGLFRCWCYLETAAAVLVYPRPADQAPDLVPASGRPGDRRGVQDPGAEDFLGLRPYRHGDSPRQLDWKAYGRGRGLQVKQFGRDLPDRMWLDWDLLPPADTETRLSWLARQAVDAALTDQDFALRVPGREIPPGRGEMQMHRCLRVLARFGEVAPSARDDEQR